MPAEAVPAGEGEQQPTSWEDRIWTIGKQVLMFFAVQYAIKSFMGGGGGGQTSTPEPKTNADGSQAAPVVDYSIVPQAVRPFWPSDTSIDVSMYISESAIMPPLHRMPKDSLVVNEKGFPLDGKSDARELHTSFSVPRQVQDNGTLWAHIFVGQTGAELDPASQQYDPTKAYRTVRPLTQYLGRKKVRKTRSLLGAQNETEIEEEIEEDNSPTIASYYHPNLTLSFIPDAGQAVLNGMHPAVKQFYTLDQTNSRDETGKIGFYYPILYLNTFWQLRSQMTELNTTHPVDRLDLNIGISTLKNWQFQVMASMDEGMKETARRAAQGQSSPGGGDGSELELIKETLLDTNPYLLGTTVIVSMLHMVFELLAFKSDVGHWRKKKDNVGVSFRAILSNVVMQSIIFLYLLDNNENTSWMIMFGQGMGIAVEAWKITKTVNVRVREPAQDSWFHGKLPYIVVFEDKHQLSETEEKTEEYDKIAFKWMGIGAVPLLLAYAAYSLVYDTHKSWYSFIITTLVGSVYAYGFLMMVPSLYINYRLHSVAHMPAKAMTYKFLNTFIDDLFAFTIKMPTLHRLATLRDDVIFFVYLYQAWAYKVDYSRVNEFGQGPDGEGDEGKIEGVKGDVTVTEEGKGKVGPEGKESKAQVVEDVKKGNAQGQASGMEAGKTRKRKG